MPVLGEPAPIATHTRTVEAAVVITLGDRLALLPDLHFDVIGVYRGESTLVINYRTLSRDCGEITFCGRTAICAQPPLSLWDASQA